MTKAFLRDAGACREMYFSADMVPEEVARLQRLLAHHASPLPVVDVRPIHTCAVSDKDCGCRLWRCPVCHALLLPVVDVRPMHLTQDVTLCRQP